jgi:hypothetical protein
MTLPANVPNEIHVHHTLAGVLIPHYAARAVDFEVSLDNIVFDLPPGYTADIPSAGVVDNVFIGTNPPVSPVPALSEWGIGVLVVALLAIASTTRRRRAETGCSAA